MTKLSVNINKIATLRNAPRRGCAKLGFNLPRTFKSLEQEGVTIHPRPDERHIRYQDARDLKTEVYTEYNIEGNPGS
jgi:pyridoxine 5-phosphate synthase